MFLANLSTAILRLCHKKGLSYEEAAFRCHISSRFFGDIVRRKKNPSIATLEKICKGLEISPNELLLPQEATV